MSGHLMPPFSRSEQFIGQIGHLTGIRADARDIILPLLVRANDIDTAMRMTTAIFNPLAGDGYLRAIDDSGQARRLICRYAGGFEGGEHEAGGWYRLVIRLRALSPFWEGEQEKNFVFESEPPVLFLGTFLPLRISKAVIGGIVTVQNNGDVETYPKIIARGPLSSLAISNQTTSKGMSFPVLTMTAGDTLMIDTRPDRPSIVLNGINSYPLMSKTSSLWSLIPGTNVLKVEVSGTGSATNISISYHERFLAP